jgi:uncharacterized membrane protein (UPF0127 family)
MNRAFAFVVSMFLVSASIAPTSVAAVDTPVILPIAPLTIGKHKVMAEVAITPDQRSVGLMHRFSLKPDHGMLFVFERADMQFFWMKNTFIALSIAFIAADGRIVNIEDMRPQTVESHYSKAPVLYALEMRKGWFAERGIGPGATVEGIAAAIKR